MKRATMYLAICVLMLCAIQCQTTAPVKVGKLVTPERPANTDIVMLSQATDARKNPSDKIGRHTISVFMIPGPGVVIRGEHLEEAIAARCADALNQAGFRVSMVENLEDATSPVLAVQIDFVRNYSFTWLYPLALTGGSMKLSLVLFSPESEILWKKDLGKHGGGMASLFYISGFTASLKSEVTGSMNEIIKVTTSDEFLAALGG